MTLLFDVGVFAVVVGLVLMVLEAFGDEITPSADGDRARPGAGDP